MDHRTLVIFSGTRSQCVSFLEKRLEEINSSVDDRWAVAHDETYVEEEILEEGKEANFHYHIV